MAYLEKELFNLVKFHCDELIDFNSQLEIRTLKVYKHKKKEKLLKYKNYFLYLAENDFINYEENSIQVFLISNFTTKKYFIAIIEFQHFTNGLKEEKLILFYETTKFWKKLLISKYNEIATNY